MSRMENEFSPADLAEILAYGDSGLPVEDIDEVIKEFDPSRSGIRLSLNDVSQV